MQRTEILISTGRREREGETVLCIEGLRLKEFGARRDGMRNVVIVEPGHRRASLHGDLLRSEGELVDLHLCSRSLRRRDRKDPRHRKNRERKRRCDAGIICKSVFHFSPAVARQQ